MRELQQLIAVWTKLDARRRMIVIGATVAMFGAILIMSRMASAPTMTLLYSNLEGAAAGEVISALEQRGAAYQVRGNAIYVSAGDRDLLRMSLAGEGLPANGTAGYELLDLLSGFGTTSQMFDAAYWRAKEGELARTIMANPHVRAARVHISNARGTSFRRDLKPSASVTVTARQGVLPPAQAKAFRYLVASSVAGMAVADVSVIDTESGLVLSGSDAENGAAANGDVAARLKENVERLLQARMGLGRSIVEVSVETVTERESIVERRFDPQERVAISTETEERSLSSRDSGGSAVTVASNLPEGDAAQDRQSSSSDSETRERVNFEVSETQREVLRTPGAIKRLSIAVLVDGTRKIGPDGAETWEPLPEEDLNALQELVASAVGLDPNRGDVLTLKSMPFEQAAIGPDPVAPGLIDKLNLDVMSAVQLAVLAIVGLILGLFVVRPILTGAPAALPPPEPGAVLEGELSGRGIEPGPQVAAIQPNPPLQIDGAVVAEPAADPVERLRTMIEERQTETVEVLRSWMETGQDGRT